jgi:hypothetical protein
MDALMIRRESMLLLLLLTALQQLAQALSSVDVSFPGWRRRILLIPVVVTMAPVLAHASTIPNLHATVSANPTTGAPCTGVLCFSQQADQSTPISISGMASGATALAEVTDGSIKLSGMATTASASSQFGAFTDILTVFAPGIANGTPGSLMFSVSVAENLGVAQVGNSDDMASWILHASYNGMTLTLKGLIDTITNPSYVGNPSGTYTETVSFVYGVAENMGVNLTASASDSTPFGGSASDDLSHSVYWGGISNVTATGVPVSSFTVTSNSGTDWSQSFVPAQGPSVPEPGTGVLFFSAIGGVWLARRHLRSRV